MVSASYLIYMMNILIKNKDEHKLMNLPLAFDSLALGAGPSLMSVLDIISHISFPVPMKKNHI